MSELINKQEVLSEITFAMVDDIPDLQKLYDKIANIEQPRLNENQQIVLDYFVKEHIKYNDSPIPVIAGIIFDILPREELYVIDAYKELDEKQDTQVLQAFIQWILEQEEE